VVEKSERGRRRERLETMWCNDDSVTHCRQLCAYVFIATLQALQCIGQRQCDARVRTSRARSRLQPRPSVRHHRTSPTRTLDMLDARAAAGPVTQVGQRCMGTSKPSHPASSLPELTHSEQLEYLYQTHTRTHARTRTHTHTPVSTWKQPSATRPEWLMKRLCTECPSCGALVTCAHLVSTQSLHCSHAQHTP
jgi:hypothetical protein